MLEVQMYDILSFCILTFVLFSFGYEYATQDQASLMLKKQNKNKTTKTMSCLG